MSRAFLIVMDSVGCGGAPDAGDFGDAGSNTLAHVARAVGGLHLPVLDGLGLGAAVRLASGAIAPGLASAAWAEGLHPPPPSPPHKGEGGRETVPLLPSSAATTGATASAAPPSPLVGEGWGGGAPEAGTAPRGRWGAATEVSRGKDTPSGHWELAGVPVPWDWTYFPRTVPAFPEALVAEVCARAGTDGILGNCHASGVPIIEALGEEHLRTGWPICYTSADSVFQIAAHEESFGLSRLLALCEALAPTLHGMRVGRVIARPFTGAPGQFRRTGNRRDYAMTPPSPTLLDRVQAAGRMTHAVGKIGDIFAHKGIGKLWKGQSDLELSEHLLALAAAAEPGSLTFANFVEFDSLYGHRRDPEGYARALAWFDTVAGAFLARLGPGDLAIFTADHGNDPTWPGTDHTRERVPVLIHGAGAGPLGLCAFADVAETIARHLGIPETGPGKAML